MFSAGIPVDDAGMSYTLVVAATSLAIIQIQMQAANEEQEHR